MARARRLQDEGRKPMNTRHAVIDSPLGELTLVADADALVGVYFRHHWYRPSADAFGPRVDAASDSPLAEAQAQLGDYLAGARSDFDLPTALGGDDLQRRVWDRLTAIPFGETITYGEIAAELADGVNGPGRRSGRRPQPALDRRSVSSGGRQERQADRLCGRARTQEVPPRSRRAAELREARLF